MIKSQQKPTFGAFFEQKSLELTEIASYNRKKSIQNQKYL